MVQVYRFGTFEMRPAHRTLCIDGQAAALGSRAFDLLLALIEWRDRVVPAAELVERVWPGLVVEENNLRQQISALRKLLGTEAVVTVPGRGYRFTPDVHAADAPIAAAPRPDLEQDIRFCTAPDGVQLAYSQIGAGPTVIKTGNWMTHLEFDLQSPIWRHLYRELAQGLTLTRYDSRGNGLSDRVVEDISFNAFVSDLETVIDAAGIERFALLGISQGCAISIAYAVRHPERVSHLVLYGGFAQGATRSRLTPAEKEQAAALLALMRLGWGKRNQAFRQVWTSLFLPDGTKEQAEWFNELERISVKGEMAARIQAAVAEIDVAALLPQVKAPTLVMHARGDALVPFEAGRRLAADIRGARFVPLEGRNHLFLESEPAFGQFLQHTREFLRHGAA